jgi:AAA+ ATPase superfamily predicted ATPase
MTGKIKIFEGPRNSGKTFLARKYAEIRNLPIYKFDFVGWFNRLDFPDNSQGDA